MVAMFACATSERYTNTQYHELCGAFRGTKSNATRHPCPVPQNSASTVLKTSQESPASLNTCWWSMEPAVQQNYCKTDTCPSWWHAEQPAFGKVYPDLYQRHKPNAKHFFYISFLTP